jgi:hypothetical protein
MNYLKVIILISLVCSCSFKRHARQVTFPGGLTLPPLPPLPSGTTAGGLPPLPPLPTGTTAGGLPPLPPLPPGTTAGGLPPLPGSTVSGGLPPLPGSTVSGGLPPLPNNSMPPGQQATTVMNPLKPIVNYLNSLVNSGVSTSCNYLILILTLSFMAIFRF